MFKNMQDFADPSGKLHLLEIGVGTGTNFQFYPPNTRVTCVDYNPNFQNFLLESMAQNTHLHFENFVVASADNMSSVSDNSVDVVVCTLVLCSMNSTQAALKEILRVLKPAQAILVTKAYGAQGTCLSPESKLYRKRRPTHNSRPLFSRKANAGRVGQSGLKGFEKLKKIPFSTRAVRWHWEMGNQTECLSRVLALSKSRVASEASMASVGKE
ncbi:hypothetical protein E2320_016126 [Naja naja]|nr:hypothetical protein E2320_016126 [Naja naja]